MAVYLALFLILLLYANFSETIEVEVTDIDRLLSPSASYPCNIQQVTLDDDYIITELPQMPVLYRGKSSSNIKVRLASSKESLTGDIYGETPVVLSSSNTFSHDKLEMKLRDYINIMNQNINAQSNETFYLFGNNDGGVWAELESLYTLPPYVHAKQAGAVVFGVGGANSGVSFHMHGPGFSETIHGAKRFFLYPDSIDTEGLFDPDVSHAEWMTEVYPAAKDDPVRPLYECIIRPGEVLYFPDKWMHATLNVEEYNVFVSVFLDLQLVR